MGTVCLSRKIHRERDEASLEGKVRGGRDPMLPRASTPKPLPRKFSQSAPAAFPLPQHFSCTRESHRPSIFPNFYNLSFAQPGPLLLPADADLHLPSRKSSFHRQHNQSPWLSLSRTSGPTPLPRKLILGTDRRELSPIAGHFAICRADLNLLQHPPEHPGKRCPHLVARPAARHFQHHGG